MANVTPFSFDIICDVVLSEEELLSKTPKEVINHLVRSLNRINLTHANKLMTKTIGILNKLEYANEGTLTYDESIHLAKVRGDKFTVYNPIEGGLIQINFINKGRKDRKLSLRNALESEIEVGKLVKVGINPHSAMIVHVNIHERRTGYQYIADYTLVKCNRG